MIHLYAVTGREAPLAGVTGIDDAAVRSVPCGTLHAIVSEHPHAPTATRAAALTHAEVIATVAAAVPALPVRFGADHADLDALCGSVDERRDRLASALDRLGGCVEFVVRPTAPAAAVTPPPTTRETLPSGTGPGRAYLERRLAEDQATRSAEGTTVERLQAATGTLDRLAVDVRVRRGPAGTERCYLVSGRDAERFATTAAQVAGSDDLVVGGPWPPYTFAEVDA